MSHPDYEHVGKRLDHLEEECAEVIKQICKIRRFGIENEFDGKRNSERLMSEIMDLAKRSREVVTWLDTTTPHERSQQYP